MKGLIAPLIKLIVFAVVTVFATSVLAFAVANGGGGGGTDFNAIFEDATQVAPGDDVRIAGVKVGQVSGVEIHDRDQAKVSFSVDRDRLPAGVRVVIKLRNLTGQRYLALEQGPGDPTQTIGSGTTIGLPNTVEAINLTELFNGFKPLFQELTAEDVNKLSASIIQVFQGESGTISELVRDTASLTNTIADKDAVIGSLIDNLNVVLGNLNAHDDQFTALLTNTEKFVTGLAAQKDSIGSAITSLSNLTAVTASILQPTRASIQGSIAALNDLGTTVVEQQDSIKQTLSTLPIKLQKIGRAATFGSWFQFYLCGLDVTTGNGSSVLLTQPLVPLPDINHVLYTSAATRCWANEDPP
jgi:phospholipid/cholesterol/gamma-HCH transport system substrate-binding protein